MIKSMSIFHAAILSVIEGVTEFLPVSSTGHLILAAKLLGVSGSEFAKSFEIFIQLGAIMAVISLYWRTLLTNKKLWLPIGAAFLPTAVVGFTLYPFIKEALLGNTAVTTISLFVGGLFLIAFERWHRSTSSPLTWKKALIIGVCQSVSIIPGVSRAAATIIGGLSVGLSRKEAVEFSFLLALPTMTAATGLDLLKSAHAFSTNEVGLLAVGFVISWVTALVVVKAFVRFVTRATFIGFGYYRIGVALLFWLLTSV